MGIEVSWKCGTHIKTKANIAHAELERIRKKGKGDLLPRDVVVASKPKRAPLHKEFEWDDSAAAEKFRVQQARHLVMSIEIVTEEAPVVKSRAYEATVLVRTKEHPKPRNVYRTREDIMRDPATRSELLARFLRDALVFRRRYNLLSEAAHIIAAMDTVLDDAVNKDAVAV